MASPLRVIYIMGSGRSGSTALDTVLGNLPGVESVGELNNLPRLGWREAQPCACGEAGPDCPFWSEVLERWLALGGDVERYIALQERFERLRSWPRLLAAKRLANSSFEDWKRQSGALFRAVGEVSGKSVLVDSSKNPVRASALNQVADLDMFLVHLVRDGRGVAWSLAKAFAKDEAAGVQSHIPPRSTRQTALRWVLVNSQCNRIRKGQAEDRRQLLRYEDYVADLDRTLAPVRHFVEEALGETLGAISADAEMRVGHTIAGNRLRMQGPLRLRADVEWRSKMSERDRRTFWRIAGPWMRQFGYAP